MDLKLFFFINISCLMIFPQNLLFQVNQNNNKDNLIDQRISKNPCVFDISKILIGPCHGNDSTRKHGFHQQSSSDIYEVTLNIPCGCGIGPINNLDKPIPQCFWRINDSGKNKHWAFLRIKAKKKYGITELISPEIRFKQENDTLKYIYYYYTPIGIDSMVFKEKPIY